MKSSFSAYWRDDRSRIICLLLMSIAIIITAHLTIYDDKIGFLSLLSILVALYIYYIFHSWFLIGRAYSHGIKGSILLNIWNNNIQGRRTITPAVAVILLMQYPIFYGCFLFLLWFSCILFYFERFAGGKIHTFFDAIYVIMISATTIGFGDIPPLTGIGKILAVFSSFFGILIFGVVSASCWYAIQTTYVLFIEQNNYKTK